MHDSEVPRLLRFKDLQRLGVTASWAGLRNSRPAKTFRSANCSAPRRGSGPPLKSMSGSQRGR